MVFLSGLEFDNFERDGVFKDGCTIDDQKESFYKELLVSCWRDYEHFYQLYQMLKDGFYEGEIFDDCIIDDDIDKIFIYWLNGRFKKQRKTLNPYDYFRTDTKKTGCATVIVKEME